MEVSSVRLDSGIKVVPFSLGLVLATVLFSGCARELRDERSCGGVRGPPETKLESRFDQPTLEQKIARYAPVRIPFNPSGLNAREIMAVWVLAKASRTIDDLFWLQSSRVGSELRWWLRQPGNNLERLLAHYLEINRGPYDRLDNHEPFVRARQNGIEIVPPKPAGANFYPADMTKDDFERFLAGYPHHKEAFQGNFTVIRRSGEILAAVPYSEEYKDFLTRAAGELREAAALVDNPSLSKYLRSRADAFLSNDYLQSDFDWMDVKDSALEVTIGPYEVYEDRLFNYKAAFEAFVTIRDREQSEKLQQITTHLKELEDNLPIDSQYKTFTRGESSPLVVVDLIYSAGDTRAGVQTVAFNLPNDERVQAQKGSKKVMLKNISGAKFETILTPIARQVIAADQQALVTFDAFFNHTLLHEISHGLGPGFIVRDGEKTTVNLALKEIYSTIEEAKADVLGVTNTIFLIGKGELPERLRAESYATFLAGVFRSTRFGIHEAHAKANLIAFNYLLEKGACRYDTASGTFAVDLGAMPGTLEALARELLLVEARGDYAAAQALIGRYGAVGEHMQTALGRLSGVPVDIEPLFELDEYFESGRIR